MNCLFLDVDDKRNISLRLRLDEVVEEVDPTYEYESASDNEILKYD